MFEKLYKFVAGILAVLIGLTPILFKMLIRGDYGDSYFQMPILFMAMFFHSLTAYFGGIYVACKSTKNIALTTFIGAICNIIVDLLLIKHIGLYAASVSTLVSYLFLALYRMYDIKKLVKLTYDYRKMIIILVFVVFELFLCYWQKKVFNLINLLFGFIFFYILNRELLDQLFHRLLKTK